jgi:sugar phosphate isomerase/epimerase
MQPRQIAAQLYTVRAHCGNARDFAASVARLRAIGYQAVQLSGVGPIPEAEINAILAGEGVACCATHEPSATILESPHLVVERLRRLNCRLTAYPYPGGIDFGDAEHLRTLARKLDAAGAILRAAGCVLGYHNHAIEFVAYRGRPVLEHIYAATDPRHVVAELDTYWVHYGGGDVVAWCGRLKGRLPFIHLKDYGFSLENTPEFREVGRGNLDWHRIIPAAESAGCEWFIVEQDTCAGDPFDSLRISYDYLRENFARD